jgi:hypothetical protein
VQELADADRGTSVAGSESQRAHVGWTAVVFVSLLALGLLIARRSLRADFFFDEMWRADMIRASNTRDQYVQHNTALAPGWLYLMRAATVFEDRRPFLRLLALGCFPVGLTILWGLLTRMLHTTSRSRISACWLATWTVLLGALCRGIANPQPYFNNYGFELVIGAAVAWSCHVCSPRQLAGATDGPRTRRIALLTLGSFIVAGPFFVQSALLMWPAACWYFAGAIGRPQGDHRPGESVTRRSWPQALADLRQWRVAAVVIGGCLVGLATGLAFYKPVAGAGDTEEFWQDVAIKDGPGLTKLVSNFAKALEDSALATSSPSVYVTLLTIAAAGYGARVVWRAWPGFLGLLACGQVAAVVFSAGAGWPVAPVRVNLGFTFLGFVLAPLGAIIGVDHLARRVARGLPDMQLRLVPAAVVGAIGVAGIVTMWPSSIVANAGSSDVFARGLTNDLLTVANDSDGESLVLSYHVMSHWYAHDLLINSSWPARTFRVARDDGSPRLFDDLDQTLAEELRDATNVWCVIPYELGPERALAACVISDSRLVEVSRVRMQRIELVHFARTDG